MSVTLPSGRTTHWSKTVPWIFRLSRRLFHSIAATAAAAAGAWLTQPDDLVVWLLGKENGAGRVRAVPNRQEHGDHHDHVVHEGRNKCRAETLLLLLEQKRY